MILPKDKFDFEACRITGYIIIPVKNIISI